MPTRPLADFDPQGVAGLLPSLLRAVEPHIRVQRWYGDKNRPTRDIVPLDFASVEFGNDAFVLLIAAITFDDGGTAHYFIPLVLTQKTTSDTAVAIVDSPAGSYTVLDAMRSPLFQTWLLDRLEESASLGGANGRFVFRSTAELAGRISAARVGPARVSSAEQSNTSVVYGGAVIVKALRRLQPGLHPDLEIGRFLTERTTFRHVPLVAGDLTYRQRSGEEMLLSLAQSFIPSAGDGWSYTLERLTDLASNRDDERRLTGWLSAAHLLGQRTGQLHLSLAGEQGDPHFSPEPITPEDTQAWSASLRAAISSTAAALKRNPARFPDDLRRHVDVFISDVPSLVAQAAGFDAQTGSSKTRVHGDYHLGQILRTLTDDFVILDFEGEPSRPMAERRAKTSPLKDVAGMLRSFGYARGALFRQLADQTDAPSLDAWLASWESSTRSSFLSGYRAETADQGATLVPAAEAAFNRALTAWELDKAIYEVNYELNNRPDWLDIPLRGIVA